MALAPLARATPLLEEGFNYPAGTALAANPPWSGIAGTSLSVVSGNLGLTNFQATTPAGNLLQIATGGGAFACRNFSDNPVISAEGAAVYFSALVNCGQAPTNRLFLATLLPAGSTSANPPNDAVDLYMTGLTNGTGCRLAICSEGSDPATARTVLLNNTTHLIVVKYTFGSNDFASLYIDPAPGAPEPAVASVVTENDDEGGADSDDPPNLQVLFFQSPTTPAPGSISFDTVRVGTNWADVTPKIFRVSVSGPQDQAVCAGSPAMFSATANGTPPFTFQWRTNGLPVGDATNNFYLLPSPSTANTSTAYDVVVHDFFGSVTSRVASLLISYGPPTIPFPPTNQVVLPGMSNAVFSVGAAGDGPLRYQWLTITADGFLEFFTPPKITQQPGDQTVLAGQNASFSVTAIGFQLGYLWLSNNAAVAGASDPTFSLTNVSAAEAGVYTLTASNSQTAGFSFGALPKANCYLTVAISGGTNFSAFNFTNYAPAGVPLTMFSWVTNVPTATNYYFWTYNSVNVISTSNTVPLSAAILTPARSGTYTVTINSTNAGGAILSGQNYDSYWAFGYPPMFTNTLPASTNVNAGASLTLSIPIRGSLNVYNGAGGAGGFATNSSTPCVFWYQNGNLVASQNYALGPTSLVTYSNSAVIAALTLNSVSAANAGNYTVVATNFWGSVTSSPVAVTVGGSSPGFAPVITTNPPAALSLLAGQSSAISVTVTGTPPYAYQWRVGGVNVANGGVFGGAFTNILTLTGVTTANSGDYTVAVTNLAGAVTSSVSALTVVLPPQLEITAGGPGGFQFNVTTITGLNYVVQTATNLAAPDWVPILTNSTGASGVINYQTNKVTRPNQFYRLLFP